MEKEEKTQRDVCVPGQDPIQISALCFGPAWGAVGADQGEPWGQLCPKSSAASGCRSRMHGAWCLLPVLGS